MTTDTPAHDLRSALERAEHPLPWTIYSEPEVGLTPTIFSGAVGQSGFCPVDLDLAGNQNLIVTALAALASDTIGNGVVPSDTVIAAKAREALGTWLAWPDAPRDGIRPVTNEQVESWLAGLPNRLGHPPAAERCYTVEGDHDAREMALAKWVREAMRFIDLCDADAGGYDDLHGDAERLTVDGYSLFGAMVEFDKWCIADLEHRALTAFLDRQPPAAEPVGLREELAAAKTELAELKSRCSREIAQYGRLTGSLATPARTDDAAQADGGVAAIIGTGKRVVPDAVLDQIIDDPHPADEDEAFTTVWLQLKSRGYLWSEGNVEKVHLGWLLALALPSQEVEPAAVVKDGLTTDDQAQMDDIRRSIIRQLGDDPHADRVILHSTDWDIVLAALSTQAACPTGAGEGLPADVIALVVAGREAWEAMLSSDADPEACAALDKALERFASRVCYDDEGGDLPEAHANPCTCGAALTPAAARKEEG